MISNATEPIHFTDEDLRTAFALLARLNMEVETAVHAIECAASLGVRNRLMRMPPPPPSFQAAAWNRTIRPGAPVLAMIDADTEPATPGIVRSRAFDISSACVLVEFANDDFRTVPLHHLKVCSSRMPRKPR